MQKKFENNKIVMLHDLKESGLYHPTLLDHLSKGIYSDLYDLPIDVKSDIDFMEPLLYAMKNEFGTFRIYQFYSKNLQQKDEELASKIAQEEPHLLENTPLCNDPKFILRHVQSAPELVKYMSPELKANPAVVSEICVSHNPSVLKEVALVCNTAVVIQVVPELCAQESFIASLIKDDPEKALALSSKELKNNYQFLKECATQNPQIIDLVVKDMKNFGLEGIKGVCDCSETQTHHDCVSIIDKNAEENTDKRYASVKKYLAEHKEKNEMAITTAMAVQDKNMSAQSMQQMIHYSLLSMEKINRELEANPSMTISKDSLRELITPINFRKLLNRLEEKGISLPEEIQEQADHYADFYHHYFEKYQEQKKKQQQSPQQDQAKTPQEENAHLPFSQIKTAIQDEELSQVKRVIADTKEFVADIQHEQNTTDIASQGSAVERS